MFPDHWTFLFGEIALYSFVVLVVTGVYLTLFFQPSLAQATYDGSYEPLRGAHMSGAYRSAVDLSLDSRAGLLIRQTHHWAALVFVAAIAVHLMRIFFTGAFRSPRDVNYDVGVTMLALALLEGFAGYSLRRRPAVGHGPRDRLRVRCRCRSSAATSRSGYGAASSRDPTPSCHASTSATCCCCPS